MRAIDAFVLAQVTKKMPQLYFVENIRSFAGRLTIV
jgi:hypothetical protein